MQVSRKDFKRVFIDDTDMSPGGKYSSEPGGIDRQERGDMGRGEFRYFHPGESGEEYIEQDYKRYEAFNRGEWSYKGIRASVELRIPHGDSFILQAIKSPGLWGIESDSEESYFDEAYGEEASTLADMLTAMGMEVID